jgi:hypothetical protein
MMAGKSEREEPAGRSAPGLRFERGRAAAALMRLPRRDQARSKRSAFITLVQAATKSFANFSFASSCA